ncbi:hypothetical protein Ddye_009685 [Dipteronia dyeriana]|uniref:Reverse transcriptase domain-containing protein n=1 Tax=Dipteronia dyeriana TaxID=168575 RepID=A0AAD9XCU9_9ROSI|nr:hypothetical protein Ddye_009685 [Dipteronia dyeriana]
MSKLPWVCMGDFNDVCYDSEKSGSFRKNWSAMSDFREAMENSQLEDIGFQGPKYTWSNKKYGNGLIMERLDMGLCNKEWKTLFLVFGIRYLDFWGSDHRPILLDFSNALSPGQGCSSRKARSHWTKSKNRMEDFITRYFSNLFTSSNPRLDHINKVLEGVNRKPTDQMVRLLEMKFSAADVRKVVFYMSPMKSPRKDSLPAIFYQKYCETIGTGFTNYCLEVLNNGRLVAECNSTIITLIPKTRFLELVSDYRPISLCNVLYKIIAKAITNRLRTVLDGVISEAQSAFISSASFPIVLWWVLSVFTGSREE